ncbi:MAG: phenylalanine--tRNA ligase subunit beta [Magnetococcales bacterium]|nr:phenylalanine--tRNA ligase subunit beta [Magnetococcales bacterium]
MKLTHHWLLTHLDSDLSPREIGDKLTMAGLELDSLVDLAQGLEKVQVGQLESVERHPNADRLTLCRVRVGEGDGETLPIVCGATNHKIGDKVAVAGVGAKLPNGLKIKKGKIRGEVSEGMLCSVAELGLAESAEGILILPEETPVGSPIADALGRNDVLFELDLTPNRGDCLGVRGVARELAALEAGKMRPLDIAPGPWNEDGADVVIDDSEGCPRYAGRIIRGVKVGPSPEWLQQRLESVGLRAINNVVDVTNFILLDMNHPMHAFDLNQLSLPIVVRRAVAGETLTTLDGEKRTLTDQMTLIADQKRPLALAGILGGEESGVVEKTTDIFLEAAYFNPIRTARTGRKLGIHSDSRHRFERGIDPEGLKKAMDRATALIVELAGGEIQPATLVDSGQWQPTPPIPFRYERANQLGGIDLTAERIQGMLDRLGCRLVENSGKAQDSAGVAYYQAPPFRHDLKREEDLVEEIVRLYGYDQVPSKLPVGAAESMPADPLKEQAQRTRRVLSGMGYLETINYAFISAERQGQFDPDHTPIPLQNPISEEQGVMRTTLIAGLLETAARNLSRGNHDLHLFEMGRIFLPDAQGNLVEVERLAGLVSGSATGRNWHTPARDCDFFDLKGDLEALLTALSHPSPHFTPGGPDFLHPGQKAELVLAGKKGPKKNQKSIGWIGQLHPRLQESLDASQPLFIFELDCSPLLTPTQERGKEEMSRFPAVDRDFAFLVPQEVPARDFLEEIASVDPSLIKEVTLFDLYTGKHVPEGQKSLALGVVFQAPDRTLKDAESQELAQRITTRMAERFSATLR